MSTDMVTMSTVILCPFLCFTSDDSTVHNLIELLVTRRWHCCIRQHSCHTSAHSHITITITRLRRTVAKVESAVKVCCSRARTLMLGCRVCCTDVPCTAEVKSDLSIFMTTCGSLFGYCQFSKISFFSLTAPVESPGKYSSSHRQK